jgi:alkylhydroperoxidase family enzyme
MMKKTNTFRKSPPGSAWLLVVMAGLILLPSSPLISSSKANPAEPAEPADAAAIDQKLAELERACVQAGLTAEETQAALNVAKRVQADKHELCKLEACGKLNAVEKRAFDKLIGRFGHPLEKELAKLREVAAEAKLTAEETAAAEKVALQEGFDNDAIVRRYESGKLSPVEKAAFEKVIAVKGHPHADEISQLTEVARQAGLTDAQLQTLRGLAARADWDLERAKELKRTHQLSEAEAAAVAKLEPFVSKLQSPPDSGGSEKVRSFRQVGKIAGLSDAETEALLEAVKQAGGDEQGLLQAKQANKLSAPAAAGLKRLESLLGNLEDFAASPHTKDIGKLLETAASAGLNNEEAAVLLKLATRANFDRETVRQFKDSGQLSDAELHVVEKVLASEGR